MKRRRFLTMSAAWLAVPITARLKGVEAGELRVMTVTGERPAAELGAILPHEHVLVDFIGAQQVTPERYDANEVFNVVLPFLKQAHHAGCRTLAECTPAYLGRDPKLLDRLSRESGLILLTNTGYYGAGKGKYLPQHAFDESAEMMAERWIREWRDGIADTGIRPGFIKTGVDAGKLPDVSRKIVAAAARCHQATGLTIAGHTGDGQAAGEQIEIIRQQGVAPGAWIWVHAQSEKNLAVHEQIARTGAWVEFDGVSATTAESHLEMIQNMKRCGLLDRVLLSHDSGWYSVGEPRGGNVRGYDYLFTMFIEKLRNAGFGPEEIKLLTVTNPANAFAIRKRVV